MLQDLHEELGKLGLKMNLRKTKVMSPEANVQIMSENEVVQNIQEYTCLCHVSELGKNNQMTEIPRRVGLTWSVFGKLQYVLTDKTIPVHLKRKIYNRCNLPVATYSLETMVLTKQSAIRLQVTQRSKERKTLGISSRDKVRNEVIRSRNKAVDVI